MKTYICSNTTDVFQKLFEHNATSALVYMRFCRQETLSQGSANLRKISRWPVFVNSHALSFVYCPRLRHGSKLEVTKTDHLLAQMTVFNWPKLQRDPQNAQRHLPVSDSDFSLLYMSDDHLQQVLELSIQF